MWACEWVGMGGEKEAEKDKDGEVSQGNRTSEKN